MCYLYFISYMVICEMYKKNKSVAILIHPPLSVLLNPNNWYQSVRPLKKNPNSLREIRMDSRSLKENFIATLEDLDKENSENDKMKYKLKKAEDYIKKLKAQIDVSRSKREELVESLKEPDNDTSDLITSLKREKEEIKEEYEVMISQLTKEIQQDKEEFFFF